MLLITLKLQNFGYQMPPVSGNVDSSNYSVTRLTTESGSGAVDIFQVLVIIVGVLFIVIFILCSACCCFGSLAINCHLCCISTNLIRIIRKPTDSATTAAAEGGAGASIKMAGKSNKKSAKKTGKKSKKSYKSQNAEN